MTVAYSPALDVSDDPATAPNEKAFVPSGGGGGSFDPSSRYTASNVGDFYDPATWYEDASKTDPADTAGDLIYTMAGGRTTGTPVDMAQATAGSRPQIASDGTHPIYAEYISAAQKFITGTASYESSANGLTIGARAKVSIGGTQTGHILMSEDWSALVDFLNINQTLTQWRVGRTTSDLISAGYTDDGGWMTALATIGTGFTPSVALYVGDFATPVATGTLGGRYVSTRYRTGHPTGSGILGHCRKFIIDNDETDALADWGAWLEGAQ